MIKLETPCKECIHCDVCRNKNKAKNSADKLKNGLYDKHPNMDYDWNTMSTDMHFDVIFKCVDFKPKETQFKW